MNVVWASGWLVSAPQLGFWACHWRMHFAFAFACARFPDFWLSPTARRKSRGPIARQDGSR